MMQTEYSADQDQFRDVVRRFMQDKSPPAAVRAAMETETGFDAQVWHQLCNEVGLAGTHIPAAWGGFGFGAVELGIVTEEMGRRLYCGPFFASSVMAGYALMEAASEAAREQLLPALATGTTLATLVLDNLNDPLGLGQHLHAGDNGVLNGTAGIVLDAHVADQLVIVAGDSQGLGLYLAPADADGIRIKRRESLDPTRKLSEVSFGEVPVERLGNLSGEAMGHIWDKICVALAHEMVGGAQYLLESTVDYTKVRVQFGRPIGSFQALKHRCADLLMEVEFARAATYHAARCLDAGEGEPYAPSMAKALASEVYMNAARAGIQLRGGIGFTWENDTHLWFKRAKSSEVFMGSPHFHRERMISILEAEA
ncbi:MAG: acyl-CoA dehydrogenase family protein [Pseudomonadota bacterium]